jgi:hypothetical protein
MRPSFFVIRRSFVISLNTTSRPDSRGRGGSSRPVVWSASSQPAGRATSAQKAVSEQTSLDSSIANQAHSAVSAGRRRKAVFSVLPMRPRSCGWARRLTPADPGRDTNRSKPSDGYGCDPSPSPSVVHRTRPASMPGKHEQYAQRASGWRAPIANFEEGFCGDETHPARQRTYIKLAKVAGRLPRDQRASW